MTQADLKNLYDRATALSLRFQARYRAAEPVQEQECFVSGVDHFFLVTPLPWKDTGLGAIVIEHAHGVDEYKLGRFEDGDRFYMDEMNEDEMFAAMVAEIEA